MYMPRLLPLVHNGYPTSIFKHINMDLAAEWEQLQGNKLLAHPFDRDAQDPV